ncbi:hypothetical protein ACFYWX_28660 [Streptomyces sp. NPDC002888]|uniref:hypothetical protein n=1 Tax=Streptomyces sp. NPDC002888 TaxID=3364668 RepID=UPI00368269CB
MSRKPDRRAGAGAGGDAGSGGGRTHVVAVVVTEPADAVPLVGVEAAGAEIAVVSLRAGAKDGRAALDRALTAAADRGCRVLGGPRVLGVDGTDDPATVAALLDVLRDLDPERLHTLDPDPAHTSYDQASGMPTYDVPAEHGETAVGALAAAGAWQAETGRPLYVDCHRAHAEPESGVAGCRRYPAPANWLSAGFDGRLTAFLPTAAGVVRRHQDTQGRWSAPEPVEGPGLLPGLLVVRDPHGFPHLFALRRTARDDGGVDVEVVHAAQYRTSEPPTPWQSIGGPNAVDWRRGRAVGFPAAAFDAAGNLFVFVRNFGHSISWRCQSADGGWTPWQHLSGLRVADELVAVTGPHGGVEVYARVRDTARTVRWYPGQGGAWTEDRTVPFAARPGTLTPAPEPGAVLFRDLHTNEASVWRPGAQAPCPLGEAKGSGPLAAVRGVEMDGWAYSVLVAQGAGGTCAVGAYPEGRPDTGVWWQDLGAPSYDAPAAAVTRTGLLTLAARTPARQLLTARREERPGALVFADWRPARG